MSVFYTRIQLKKDSEENWNTNNPVILDGEHILVVMPDGSIASKYGDGVSHFRDLEYAQSISQKVVLSTSKPTGLNDGDFWYKIIE